MPIKGLPPNAPLKKAEPGLNDDAVQNLADPLNNVLSTLHSAFGGTTARPMLNGSSIGVLPKVNLPGGSYVQVVADHLVYKAPSGNTYRLDRQSGTGGSGPTGSVSPSQITPGSNGQFLSTVAGVTSWVAAPTGSTGPQGPAGPAGPAGSTGATGPQGPSGTSYSVFGASGSSHSQGIVPDPGATMGTVHYLREDATWVTPPNTTYTTFGPSGGSHASGLVPDPGSTAGTTRFLREDATWTTTPAGTTYSTFMASGTGHAAGLVPDPGSTAGTTRFLREDATWTTTPGGTTYSTFGASGTSHATGLVPDPGSTSGTTRYLREDATFQTPPDHTYSTFIASGTSAASGLVPTPPSTAGAVKFLREDATWVVPAGGASGLQAGIEGVLNYSPAQTWSGSGGQTYTWTVPSTINGNSYSSVVITKVTCTLLSGTPGTAAKFGVTIAGVAVVGISRQLPTYGGGTNSSIVDINVQNISQSGVNPASGQTVVVTSGGTFSNSTTWRVDIIGYYL